MIFIDTNVLLSLLTTPVTTRDVEMHQNAASLFSGVAEGTVQATTNDVVLHEVCWVLGSPHRYGVTASEIIDIMRSVLNWPGWVFPSGDLQVYFRALEFFERDHKLEFSDSIIAARAEALDAELATFDARLASAYPGTVWS